jgi:hypothetical protein
MSEQKISISSDKIKLENIEETIKCDVCKDILYNSVTLVCQHTFCNSCITPLKECPMCRLKIHNPVRTNKLMNDIVLILYGPEKCDELNNKNKKELMEKELLPKVLEEMKSDFNKSIQSDNSRNARDARNSLNLNLNLNNNTTNNLMDDGSHDSQNDASSSNIFNINNIFRRPNNNLFLKYIEFAFLVYYMYGFYKSIKLGDFNMMRMILNLVIILQSVYSLFITVH